MCHSLKIHQETQVKGAIMVINDSLSIHIAKEFCLSNTYLAFLLSKTE